MLGCPTLPGDPYRNWQLTKDCIGIDGIDYVFDSDLRAIRISALENDGCEEIVQTVVTFDVPRWKKPFVRENILFGCT